MTNPTCESCNFARYPNGATIQCWGSPPTPVVIGAGHDTLGRTQMRIECIRAQLPKATPACGFHQAYRPEKDLQPQGADLEIDILATPGDPGTHDFTTHDASPPGRCTRCGVKWELVMDGTASRDCPKAPKLEADGPMAVTA